MSSNEEENGRGFELDQKSLLEILEAYEKLSLLSREELLKANDTILAYQKIISLSREELIQAKEEINELKHRENILKKEILSLFRKSADEDSFILEKIKNLGTKKIGFYGEIFHLLTSIYLPEEEAEKYWEEILIHSQEITQQLNRKVSLRVAMLDYLLHKQPLMKSPKFVEIDIFEQIIRNSVVDELTGIFNRRYFNESLLREIKRCKRYSKPLCLFVFDLDNFKQFNDMYGHLEGDRALQFASKILMKNFRTEDIICRTGGEEFAVILPEVTPKEAKVPCERFAKKLKEESLKCLPNTITLSGGIAFYPKDGETPEDLYRASDTYAYFAKQSGKDKIFVTSF